jgi:hypothetical protein
LDTYPREVVQRAVFLPELLKRSELFRDHLKDYISDRVMDDLVNDFVRRNFREEDLL